MRVSEFVLDLVKVLQSCKASSHLQEIDVILMCGEVVQHGDGLLKPADLCIKTIHQAFCFSLHILLPLLHRLEGFVIGCVHEAKHSYEHSPDA